MKNYMGFHILYHATLFRYLSNYAPLIKLSLKLGFAAGINIFRLMLAKFNSEDIERFKLQPEARFSSCTEKLDRTCF